MKRVLLSLLVLIIVVSGAFATTTTYPAKSTATVSLDLNAENFRIGFATSEDNAKAFTASTADFVLNQNITGSSLTASNADGSMYFFYKAALEKNTTYSLTAKIDKALTQTDDNGEYVTNNPDTIAYKATITGNISNNSFTDGQWVTQTVATASPIKSGDSAATTILSNLRGTATQPYSVVYASALKIDLATTEENIGAKKAAVYKSTITFTVKADK